ncbi:DUF2637 domain-containing protein [Actinoplanes sp. NPDC049599]|uniref:DUF2637 domain-containing protein n=1 Tax=Actinoplanes sp. NPDC049599 TaxID=3363903 RepID=UPI00379DE842
MNERADRAESVVLVLIVVTVAASAGWASFTHVHDWTMRHAPAGTPDAFGWVNAVISELVPVAAFLVIRRRRKAGAPIGYPLTLLIAAASLSLAAQLAVAQPSPSGWLLSAVPALAFMALVKLVLTTPTIGHAAAGAPMTVDTAATSAADHPAASTRLPEPAPRPAAVVAEPATRPTAVVPVPAGAFTRLNGTPATSEATTR